MSKIMVLPVLDLRLLFKMIEKKATRNKNEILAINKLEEAYLVSCSLDFFLGKYFWKLLHSGVSL